MTKKSLRSEIKKIISALSTTEKTLLSKQIQAHIESSESFKNARTIAFYIAMPDEVELNWLFKHQNKTLLLPRYNSSEELYEMAVVKNLSEDTVNGLFGISEPKPENALIDRQKIDLWLIPGRAFDLSGNRLGRGGGFYDRLLLNSSAHKLAIAFDFQIVQNLPTETWDIPMDSLVTEQQFYNF